MNKNLILTMLACLNCVHTTHAVEMSETMNMQQADQGNGQESLDELEQQYYLHTLGDVIGTGTRRVEMKRNAAIQREEVMQKVYAHKKDALSPNDKRRPSYDALIDKGRDAVENLRNLPLKDVPRFVRERHQAWHDNNAKDSNLPYWEGGVTIPLMTLAGDLLELGEVEQDMKELAKKYPGITKKKRDLYRKWWAFALNVNIKAGNWRFDNLRAGINQLDESKTGIGQEMKKTILNTIHNNLIGEDQDLAEKTMALLKQDPVLAQKLSNVSNAPEMKKALEAHDRMPLLKTMKHKKQTQHPLTKVQDNVFREIINKY